MRIKRVTTKYYDVQSFSRKPFGVYGEFCKWREQRGTMKECFKKCFACGKSFDEHESIYIASVKGTSNKFLCLDCNVKALPEPPGGEGDECTD